MLHEKLTASDIKKIEEEIEHRKLVIRKEALESVKEKPSAAILSTVLTTSEGKYL